MRLIIVRLWGSLYTTCEVHRNVFVFLQAHRADWSVWLADWFSVTTLVHNPAWDLWILQHHLLAPHAAATHLSNGFHDWVKMLAEKNGGRSKAGSQYWRLQRWRIRLFEKKQDLWPQPDCHSLYLDHHSWLLLLHREGKNMHLKRVKPAQTQILKQLEIWTHPWKGSDG